MPQARLGGALEGLEAGVSSPAGPRRRPPRERCLEARPSRALARAALIRGYNSNIQHNCKPLNTKTKAP